MDDKLAIILLSTLLPAIAVGYIMRSNGKTLNFSIFGGTLIYVLSVLLTFALFALAPVLNMPATDLVLLLPFAVAIVFYILFKSIRYGDEK